MKKLVIAAMMLAATGVTAMCAVTPPIVNGEVFPIPRAITSTPTEAR